MLVPQLLGLDMTLYPAPYAQTLADRIFVYGPRVAMEQNHTLSPRLQEGILAPDQPCLV